MTRSESIGNLAAALAKAQGAMHGAVKDSRNPHFSSRYADLASVWDACRGALAANEIAVVQVPSTPEAGLVGMTTMLLHASGEWIQSDPMTVQVKDAGPQAVGSGNTYCRRYQLAAMVGVAPEDDDGEAAEARPVSQQTARPAPQAKPNYPPRVTPAPPKPVAPAGAGVVKRAAAATVDERGNPLNADDIPF